MINSRTLSQLPPIAKLLTWAVSVALLAGGLQLAASLLGIDFSIAEKSSGGTAIVLIAFTTLLVMMAVENRPSTDYGLVADAAWLRRGLTGAAIGGGCYLAYCVYVWSTGVFVLYPEAVTWSQSAKALLTAATAIPVAVTHQIIFSGYLLTTVRDRHHRLVALCLPAILFALAVAATSRGGLMSSEGGRLFFSMMLLQTLLGMLRLRTGSIVLPAGVLAGCILVRKVLTKSHLIDADWHHPDLWWLAPTGDPRQGILMWVILGFATLGVGFALWRGGERQIEPDAEVDASFKRFMPFSNLLGMAPLDRWIVLLWHAKFRIGLLYLPRLVVSLTGSLFSTVLALPERILGPLLLRHDVPPPVFIVGMPRSGTTHLHNLLALDPQFRSPRNYEVFNPHGFLTGWLTTACLAPFMTVRRPMDSVQMTAFSAQEEEFALATMGSPSPYWSFCLPREIDRHDRYWLREGFNSAELSRWQRHYTLFLRKLTVQLYSKRRRTPLLKNPANTGRVAMLKQLFPQAKFIHIVRHPHAVWQSNQRLAEHGLAVFQLQNPRPEDNYATRSLANYRRLMDEYYADVAALDRQDVVEVRFEDLEAAPLETVEAIYEQLGVELTEDFAQRLAAYLDRLRGYRKNRFARLSAGDAQKINDVMALYLKKWGYSITNQQQRAA